MKVIFAALILEMLFPVAAMADWCINASYSAEGAAHVGRSSGQECNYPGPEACQAALIREKQIAKDNGNDGWITFTCEDRNGGATASGPATAPGVNDLVSQSAEAIGKGMATGNQQLIGAGAAGVAGALVIQSLFGSGLNQGTAPQNTGPTPEELEAQKKAADTARQISSELILSTQAANAAPSANNTQELDGMPLLGSGTPFFGKPVSKPSASSMAAGEATEPQLSLISISNGASISGQGLTAGPADAKAPPNPGSVHTLAATNSSEESTVASAQAEKQVGAQDVALANSAPLLRSADPSQPLPNIGDATFSSCTALKESLDEAYGLMRYAALAEDVYDRYSEDSHGKRDKAANLALSMNMYRISDNPEKLKALFPDLDNKTTTSLLNPADSDYRAAIYQSSRDGRLFLVFRGTHSLDPTSPDWQANGSQTAGYGSVYFQNAITLAKLMKQASERQNVPFEIVGHSLGGGMADAAGAVTHAKTTTFNPEGVNPNTLSMYAGPNVGEYLGQAEQYDTDYVVKGEIVSSLQDFGASNTGRVNGSIGRRVNIDSAPADQFSVLGLQINPANTHGMAAVFDAIAYRYATLLDQSRSLGCK